MSEVVAEPVKAAARRYRVTRHSVVWFVAAVLLVPYELLCIARGVEGGPLSHVVWWAYGDRYSLRWWLIGSASTGFLGWCAWHFLFRWPELPHLLALVIAGLLAGAAGYLITR